MTGELTVGQLWRWLTADEVSERLLDWAPDVAALTTELIRRSQAFRLVVSPAPGVVWPPEGADSFTALVSRAAGEWCGLMDDGPAGAPEVVRRLWNTVVEQLDTPISDLADGRPWPLCEAVLMLHAIADEATAGCGGSGQCLGGATVYLSRARELLVRTGSLARLPVERLTQLPKTRTTQVGMTHRSLSRYSCTTTAGIATVWHRAPIRRLGGSRAMRHSNLLLLPWPLRVRESDFAPVPRSIRRPEREPFGFFSYEPSEPLDLGLVDRLLEVALEEVDAVDVVALPESTLRESDVAGLEAVLAKRHVPLLVGGMRTEPAASGRMPGNAVHVGILVGGRWFHYRQNKHHRWYLDGGQVEQYNLAGALHPAVRWWEAMEIPRREVHLFELGEGLTVVAVVCEDLARLDGVAELIRSLGPSLVMVLLLDGPQLASRWTARYAGVLADDPGSAVISLTAFGMTARSRPRGMPPSRVIAMWKDPAGGLLEIPLEPGAQGVLIKTVHGPSPRHAADGRAPVDDCAAVHVVGIEPLQAAASEAPGQDVLDECSEAPPPLDTEELSVVSAWADAVADALLLGQARGGALGGVDAAGSGAGRLDTVLAQAGADASWRAAFGLPAPSGRLAHTLAALDRLSRTVLESAGDGTRDTVLASLRETRWPYGPDEQVGRLVHRLLRASLDAVL